MQLNSVFHEDLLLWTQPKTEILIFAHVGKLLAFDINQGKLHLLEKAAKKLGVETVVQTRLCDLREVPVSRLFWQSMYVTIFKFV